MASSINEAIIVFRFMVSCNNEATTRFSSMVLHIRETVMLFAFMVFFFSRSGASFPSIVISPLKGDNNKY